MNTLVVNLILNTIIFYLAYRWLLKPHLHRINPALVVMPILLLQGMRHLGLMFLTTGVVAPDMPQAFAIPAAAGDFLSATLAMTAATLIARQSRHAVAATWVFTVVGLLDFTMAIALSRIFLAGNYLGGAYWIPAFWVPMLLVGHGIIIGVLRRVKRDGLSLSL